MSREILMISTMEDIEACGRAIEQQVNARVEVASSRKAALVALRHQEFGVVIVEESMAESDPAWAEVVWELAGLAVPLEVNFVISGSNRLAREVKAALTRRDGEHAMARRAVAREMEDEFKSSLTGLLLQSELALREPAVPAALQPKLKRLVELAGALRDRLEHRQAAEA